MSRAMAAAIFPSPWTEDSIELTKSSGWLHTRRRSMSAWLRAELSRMITSLNRASPAMARRCLAGSGKRGS